MSTASKPKVTILPKANGPYVVQNLERLTNSRGAIPAKPTMALCRCGGSANKPFCDGAHSKNGFSSLKKEESAPDQVDSYRGQDIDVHDNRSICAHAGYCTDGLPSVFRYGEEPWVDPNGAPADEIVATIRKCPSGALTFSRKGATSDSDAGSDASIFVAPNGPYVITGSPDLLETASATGAATDRLTLCRCGGSANKPFCDGTHWNNGFVDEKN